MRRNTKERTQRGNALIVVVFLATAIAMLAAIGSSRVVTETRHQTVMEDQTRSYVDAFGQIQQALNVVNTSGYDDDNHNLVLRAAIAEPVDDSEEPLEWLRAPDGVTFGLVEGTEVRVYRGRDYIQRLQDLNGENLENIDPLGRSDKFFVLEAIGRSRDTVRIVSALVRETQPFSSYVFFQDQHTLGVSGTPRGLVHANTDLAFYFPDGYYADTVSSVGGFEYKAGATPENTVIADGNDNATPIDLQAVDFDDLRSKANLYVGPPGLDAEIELYGDGRVRIKPYTQPTYIEVETTYTQQILTGYETVTTTQEIQVQVGTTTETRTREIVSGYRTETYTVQVPLYETQEVTKTRQVPIYETQQSTCERWVRVFVPLNGDAGAGGTTIGDSGEGVLGEYQWVKEEYPCTEQVLVGYTTETYTTTEEVVVGYRTEERTREVPLYENETYTVEVPVYETQTIEVTEEVPVYKEITKTRTEHQYQPPIALAEQLVWVKDTEGTIFVDGRITQLSGDLNGRLTIVSTDKVRVTGDIQYVDSDGDTAMLNGDKTNLDYERNPDYNGSSVLGVIAKDDILFTWEMGDKSEVNATLLSVEGRVGADGILLDPDGNPVMDTDQARKKYLTPEEYEIERAYDRSGNYKSERFVKDSLRRLGGLISNERIIETFIRGRNDGTAYVADGFKRGTMRYDFNLRFNPPPNFVEIPRPAVTAFVPVIFNRDDK